MSTAEELWKSGHQAKAEELLAESRRLRARSQNPDAAGSSIRKGWGKRADVLLAEAQVHASLGQGSS